MQIPEKIKNYTEEIRSEDGGGKSKFKIKT